MVSMVIWLSIKQPSNKLQNSKQMYNNKLKIEPALPNHFSDFLSNNRQAKLKNLCPQSIESLKNDAALLNPLLNPQHVLKFSKDQAF